MGLLKWGYWASVQQSIRLAGKHGKLVQYCGTEGLGVFVHIGH